MTAGTDLPQRIVIPLANPATADDLIRIGAALLADGGTLTALSIVEIPEGEALSEGATRARQARRLLQRALEFVPQGVELQPVVRIGRRADEGIVELAAEEEADLILFGWGGPGRVKPGTPDRELLPVFSPTIDQVIHEHPCDIAVVKQRGIGRVERIVAPVRGGPHAELAMRFANALQRSFEADLDVMHVIPPSLDPAARLDEEQALERFVETHGGGARAHLVEGDDVVQAILGEAQRAQLLVMGAAAEASASIRAPLFGRLVEHVAQEAQPTVIVVRTRDVPTHQTFEERARVARSLEAADKAVEHQRSIPARVDRWFGERSFGYTEFDSNADLRRLLELKEKRGLTISAVLPTLNEAETIGPIVRTARRELMKIVPLLDELLVIDSDSDDDTRAIAEDEGARVVVHQQVLPKYGAYRGKGEALWKSLYETSGDLVVWCDTDVRDWHHRFLSGTLGPLITQPEIQYVKAYYQRPIVQGDVLVAGGGGRVTELMARPLINLFMPELSGIIQPLSGEYAGRRSVLERIPFFTGYAVEIGHLMDLSRLVGLDGFAQVDLEIRHHRNQDLEGLSKMAFAILHAVMTRLQEHEQARLLRDTAGQMMLPRWQNGELRMDDPIRSADDVRPPMIEIPEYRRARGLSDEA